MIPLIILVLILIVVATCWLNGVPPGATTVVRIRAGDIRVERGQVKSMALEHVTDLLKEAGVTKGFIALSERRVSFSRSIPSQVRQRLRNVMLNQ
jgi:hypothetical protein